MSSEPLSTITKRLARRVELTAEEVDFLESLTKRRSRIARGEAIQAAGQAVSHAFLLLDGWAITFTDFPDGSRQVRRLHLPGDFLGMPSMAMRHHVENVEAITDAMIAPFDRHLLAGMFREHPRLAAIFFIFAQEERITSGDRLCSLGRLPCKARIAFLLMDILTRLRAIDGSLEPAYEMHLTRAQTSEITGMTPVHASRMWSELIAEGAIREEKEFVVIQDEERLISLSGFANRAADLDFSWVAGPEAE